MIHTGEENHLNEQTTCKYSENGVYFSPYYDFNNISTGDKNAWDDLIFHSFVTPQEQKYELHPSKTCNITSDLTGYHRDSSAEMYNDPCVLNEQKNLNDIQEKMETEELFDTSKLHVLDPNDIDKVLIYEESIKSAVFNDHSFEKKYFNGENRSKKDLRKRRSIIISEDCAIKTKLKIKEYIMLYMKKGYIGYYKCRRTSSGTSS